MPDINDPITAVAAFVVGFWVGLNYRDSVDWVLLRLRKRLW